MAARDRGLYLGVIQGTNALFTPWLTEDGFDESRHRRFLEK